MGHLNRLGVEREAFVSKCETYLSAGLGVIVVDIVTDRGGNLHDELMALVVASAVMFSSRGVLSWLADGNQLLSFLDRKLNRYAPLLAILGLSFVLLSFQ